MPDTPDLRLDEPDAPAEDDDDEADDDDGGGGRLADGAEADDPDLPHEGDDPMDGAAPTG